MKREHLLNAATQFGTPLYVYDVNRIMENYHRFRNAFDLPKLDICYACKALSNISILNVFNQLGASLDCVSIEEIRLGLEAGFPPERILFTPNNIAESEYDQAIQLGVRINVDNLQMLEYIGRNHPGVPVFVRINPHLLAGGNRKISVGHLDSKFGISIHQVPHIKRLVENYDIQFVGIHLHTGSDILDPDVFDMAAQLIFEVVDQFDSIEHIDLGSGFKVPYRDDDVATDINAFGAHFSERFRSYCEQREKDFTCMFEPGKFMVSDAGYFLTRANVIKQTTACVFVGVNSGFNHLIRPMMYDAYHDIINLSNPDGQSKIYNVVGYICETDTFASDRKINEVRVGDILAFKNAGAYSFMMSSNYNSRPRPAEVMFFNDELTLIRKAETFDDLIRNQIKVDITASAEGIA